MSFFIIGVIWVNHHALFARASRVDRGVMFYNLLLLMFVVTIPFTTSTLAGYLRAGGTDERVAVVLYGISMEGMAISFTLILWHLVRRNLLLRPVSAAQGRTAVRRFGTGTLDLSRGCHRRARVTRGDARALRRRRRLLHRGPDSGPADS